MIISGVLQGYVLGPLLFSMHVNDIFLYADEAFLSNDVDDTALHSI